MSAAGVLEGSVALQQSLLPLIAWRRDFRVVQSLNVEVTAPATGETTFAARVIR